MKKIPKFVYEVWYSYDDSCWKVTKQRVTGFARVRGWQRKKLTNVLIFNYELDNCARIDSSNIFMTRKEAAANAKKRAEADEYT